MFSLGTVFVNLKDIKNYYLKNKEIYFEERVFCCYLSQIVIVVTDLPYSLAISILQY